MNENVRYIVQRKRPDGTWGDASSPLPTKAQAESKKCSLETSYPNEEYNIIPWVPGTYQKPW